ncbi:hypothetical protein GT039_38625, partial [Streptomyces sp. SID2955]|nr:hypothetical protein [Streptomyces sp. SID2955]
VVVVDAEERVRAFLPQVGEVVGEGLMTLEECEIVRYGSRAHRPEGTGPEGTGREGIDPGDTGPEGEKSL